MRPARVRLTRRQRQPPAVLKAPARLALTMALGQQVAYKATRVGSARAFGGLLSVVLVLIYVLQRVFWLDVLAILVAGAIARDAIAQFLRIARRRSAAEESAANNVTSDAP